MWFSKRSKGMKNLLIQDLESKEDEAAFLILEFRFCYRFEDELFQFAEKRHLAYSVVFTQMLLSIGKVVAPH